MLNFAELGRRMEGGPLRRLEALLRWMDLADTSPEIRALLEDSLEDLHDMTLRLLAEQVDQQRPGTSIPVGWRAPADEVHDVYAFHDVAGVTGLPGLIDGSSAPAASARILDEDDEDDVLELLVSEAVTIGNFMIEGDDPDDREEEDDEAGIDTLEAIAEGADGDIDGDEDVEALEAGAGGWDGGAEDEDVEALEAGAGGWGDRAEDEDVEALEAGARADDRDGAERWASDEDGWEDEDPDWSISPGRAWDGPDERGGVVSGIEAWDQPSQLGMLEPGWKGSSGFTRGAPDRHHMARRSDEVRRRAESVVFIAEEDDEEPEELISPLPRRAMFGLDSLEALPDAPEDESDLVKMVEDEVLRLWGQ